MNKYELKIHYEDDNFIRYCYSDPDSLYKKKPSYNLKDKETDAIL